MSTQSTPHIAHSSLVEFSENRVNLKREFAKKFRDQARNVRDHIQRYISENPSTGLVKTLLSGSLAKHTALKTLNDIDIALYVKADIAPAERDVLLEWLAEQLRTTYPQKDRSDIYVDDPCVVIKFQGTGLSVDVMPIYDEGDEQGKGYIWSRYTREQILTSIPQHLEFIRIRNATHNKHFTQLIRLIKWWAQNQKNQNNAFKARSFMFELLFAHYADSTEDLTDYPEALRQFFLSIVTSELKQPIWFSDFYDQNKLKPLDDQPILIYDPVNPENNVTSDYSDYDRRTIVDSAEDALEAITYAQHATTQAEALSCWKDVFGSSFN